MSDSIELPNNAENFYGKAVAYIQRQRYPEAIDALEKSLSITFTITAFDELVKLYLNLKQYSDLKQLWDRYLPDKEDRIQDETLRFLYGISVPYLFPLDHAIIELYQLRDYTIKQQQTTEHFDQLLNEWQKTKAIRDAMSQTESPNDLAAIYQTLYQDGPLECLVQLKKIYELPIEETEQLLLYLVKQPALENFVKNDILHYLLKIDYHSPLELNWFGQSQVINLASLLAYNQQIFYKQTLDAINDYSQQENPHLRLDIIHHFNLHAMVYYPYIEDIFASPNEWLTLFLQHNQLASNFSNPPSEKAKIYFQKALNELEKILTLS
ncbi:hypothetical protein [Fundicoccus culcitae]|uniref:Uncharacterized protein n=1 Tax=Fundicoccus culcitae TaxID=2969821 RepID=A0ABY5P6F5_9LACT|nr:hypothetical protein [Fundicoccus culcitae]UUX34322.1 hypothetical protein NRE15_01345 [Fundicoccus culcitae]